MMSNVQSFISAFGNAFKTVKSRAYESIDKLGYDLFYSDPRKTRVKLLKNKHVKTNQQELIYEKPGTGTRGLKCCLLYS